MMKKYVSPELELLILEQTDIIAVSMPGVKPGPDIGEDDDWGDNWD